MGLGGWEWAIILVIVIIIFGVGRLGKIGGEMGSAIRNFREGLKTEDEKAKAASDEKKPEEKAV
jgi:sec-independent protein translocase protein TatA